MHRVSDSSWKVWALLLLLQESFCMYEIACGRQGCTGCWAPKFLDALRQLCTESTCSTLGVDLHPVWQHVGRVDALDWSLGLHLTHDVTCGSALWRPTPQTQTSCFDSPLYCTGKIFHIPAPRTCVVWPHTSLSRISSTHALLIPELFLCNKSARQVRVCHVQTTARMPAQL
jgi:hypothetical protein